MLLLLLLLMLKGRRCSRTASLIVGGSGRLVLRGFLRGGALALCWRGRIDLVVDHAGACMVGARGWGDSCITRYTILLPQPSCLCRHFVCVRRPEVKNVSGDYALSLSPRARHDGHLRGTAAHARRVQ